eukprot:7160128-Prymnesium_polylepis.1
MNTRARPRAARGSLVHVRAARRARAEGRRARTGGGHAALCAACDFFADRATGGLACSKVRRSAHEDRVPHAGPNG